MRVCVARAAFAYVRGLSSRKMSTLFERLFPAMLAAKIERLSVALGAKSRRLIRRHSANGVFGHQFFLAVTVVAANGS